MAKNLFKHLMPSPESLKRYRGLHLLAPLIEDPNLLHLNRYSVSMAFATGLFVAFLPLPFQMVVAAIIALAIRCNLPISVAIVWITNPVTMPFIFYGNYVLGSWLLDMPVVSFDIELTWQWLREELIPVWQPLLVGSVTAGTIVAFIGYFTVRIIWRIHVIRQWKIRVRKKRLNKSLSEH